MPCCSPQQKQDDESQHASQSSCCSIAKKEKREEDADTSYCSVPKQQEEAQKQKITRDMTIEEILEMFPYKAQRLSQEISHAGLHCVGCQAAVWETLEGGMYTHGKTDPQIEELVRRLNALLEEEVDLGSIRITPRGAAKFLALLAEEGKQGWGMRFAEEMAGCNGFEYVLDFSEKAEEDDEIFPSNGIQIHVKRGMVSRLIGSEIDYVEGLRGSGFKISNPNVRSSCGCGTSHNY